MKEYRWFVNQRTFDAMTPEMREWINDPTKSSIWSSGLLLDIICYDNLLVQLVELSKLVERKLAVNTQ